jgi:hypothetical protein
MDRKLYRNYNEIAPFSFPCNVLRGSSACYVLSPDIYVNTENVLPFTEYLAVVLCPRAWSEH